MKTALLVVIAAVLMTAPASAQTPTVAHAAIDCGTSSTAALAAAVLPTSRLSFKLVNDSDTVIYISEDGAAAAVNAGVRLNASGGSYVSDVSASQNAINCIHGGSGTKKLLVTSSTLP